MHRRAFLATGSVWFAWPIVRLWAAADRPTMLNRAPRMMQRYVLYHERRIAAERNRRIMGLRTEADALRYVEEVRRKIAGLFGPFPPRTPLKPRITGILQRDSYRIEKLIFESRPGFWVTANLYVPNNLNAPAPGVIGTCGHSALGKAADAYQAFAQGLAKQGYVVLIYDPIGQGERLQYPDDDLRSRVGGPVREHLMAGNQQLLVGEFLGTWRAWDGIRALDYLLSRDEVDPHRIGVTGNSGGGTMTTWLAALDDRWTMAAPSCFVTSIVRNAENELSQDIEQCPPNCLAEGIDHGDFLAALAPRPVIILAKEGDYFDVIGTQRTYQQLKHLYRLLGAEQNVALFVGAGYHGYSKDNREAMYRWFNRHAGRDAGGQEPELQLERPEDLWCTARGQVVAEGSRTVVAFTRAKAEKLKQSRGSPSLSEVQRSIRSLLALDEPPRNPPYRILRLMRRSGYPVPFALPYVLEAEPEILIWVYRLYPVRHYSRPPARPRPAVLYVSHQSADRELQRDAFARQQLSQPERFALYACDLRGIGESRPRTGVPDSFLDPYGNDYLYASHALMLGRPYVGQRTFDVLTVLSWLRSIGHHPIHLAAAGWGCLPATFAGLLHDGIEQITLLHPLRSFHEVAMAERYRWPLSSLVPRVLAHFDLPDCYRLLRQRLKLSLVEPVGPEGVPA